MMDYTSKSETSRLYQSPSRNINNNNVNVNVNRVAFTTLRFSLYWFVTTFVMTYSRSFIKSVIPLRDVTAFTIPVIKRVQVTSSKQRLCTATIDLMLLHQNGNHQTLIKRKAPYYSKIRRHETSLFYSTDNNINDKIQDLDDSSSIQIQELEQNEQINDQRYQLDMENLYRPWSIEDDQLLFDTSEKMKNKSGTSLSNQHIIELAILLGRGMKGITARLEKLRDVQSTVYKRFFIDRNVKKQNQEKPNELENNPPIQKIKLKPVADIIQRIQWDYSLPETEFFVLHYDRVDDKIIESSFVADNDTIKGKATKLINALPEHRIVAIKYKERVVWDRENRIDLFSTTEKEITNAEDNEWNDTTSSSAHGIHYVMNTYDAWKQERDAMIEIERQRKEEILVTIQQTIGVTSANKLFLLSTQLLESREVGSNNRDLKNSKWNAATHDVISTSRIEAEQYVNQALSCFQTSEGTITLSNYDALNILSEFVSICISDKQTCMIILTEVQIRMNRIVGIKNGTSTSMKIDPSLATDIPSTKDVLRRQLPTVDEKDLEETFIRGTGPGGQKVNKTSNRVVLVHKPTGIRIECQETRSLPQNRKIARKRLQEKLDSHLYGSLSKASVKAQQIASKKVKAKQKAKARLAKKNEDTTSNDSSTTVSEIF